MFCRSRLTCSEASVRALKRLRLEALCWSASAKAGHPEQLQFQ